MQLSTCLGRVRTSLDVSRSPLRTHPLRCRQGGRLERATTSLLLHSPQIQSLERLLDQSMIGNQILYSQSIMIINANANIFTNLSYIQWEDTMFEGIGHKRQVNVILGNLVCLHYPSKVTRSDGTSSPATSWADYALSPNATYETTHVVVWSNFWVCFLAILFQSFIPGAPDFGNA
jgi:hypothetical protein